MPFTKIVPADLQGKGVIGQPAVPGLSVTEMQESVEQIVREVAIPAVNRLVDELGATTAAGNIGAVVPDGLSAEPTVQDVVSAIHEAANSGKDEVAGDLEQHKSNTSNPHAVTAAQTGAYTKEETDAAIDAKVVQIGAGDMAQAVYDPARLGVDVTVQTYTHTRSGTVHNFAGSGANGRALMTADVQAGDTFAVNGEPVAAYMGTESAAGAMAGSQWNGRWVSFIATGDTLNFKGGGGRVTVSGLSADKILKGTTVTVKQGAKTVASVSGTIPSKTAATYTPATADQTIAAGQYLSGAQTVKGDANLKAENIKQGASIFGVAGALKLLYAGGCKTGTYAGGVRWNGASYVYEGHSYFYLTGQPKTLYVQYEATPYVKVDGKTYGPGQHDISSAKANCYVEYGDTGSRAGICILGV